MSNNNKTRRVASRSYKTVSRTSDADELLFGASRPQTRNRGATQQSALSGFFTGEGTTQVGGGGRYSARNQKQETKQIITSDQVRTIRVRRPDNENDGVLEISYDEYMRLKNSAKVKTKEEINAERLQRQEEASRLAEESAMRKQQMQRLEEERSHREPMSDLDIEAKERNEHLLHYARQQMEEDEEEIKQLNELILQAKIYSIRDAQLAEKEAIRREEEEEERRLDEMMEIERVRALKAQEEKELALRTVRKQRAELIKDQLVEREEQRVIEEEMREQETQAMLNQMKEMEEEDRIKAQKKREEGLLVMEEVARVNEAAQRIKKQRELELIEEDHRLAEYLKEKQVREEEYEQEKIEEKKRRDREFAALLSMQEQAMDKVAEKQGRDARRQQEAVERKRRQRDLEEARAREESNQALMAAREEQIRAKERFIALQAHEEREQFESIVQSQKEEVERLRREEEEDRARRLRHNAAVRTQIEKKEVEQRNEREQFFEEGRKLKAEADARRQRLDEIKQRKLAQLKAAGVDTKYLVPAERLVAARK
eukprot:m.87558 g.87558  ORF g.87558 m.87558 type:complete len:544 (-) comp8790_c1_seq5:1883-3514(-)